MFEELTFWIVFSALALIIIIIDLYVTDHRPGKAGLKTSLIWSGVWITTALLFNAGIYFFMKDGHIKGLEFTTGYLIEYSLSVDNLFVFLLIFRVMDVPLKSQPHVLKWGILSAIIFRIVFILAGVGLINLFHPIIYLFAIILLFASYKMAFGGEEKIDYEKNPLIKFVKRFFNITNKFEGNKFFVKQGGKFFATSLFLTLIVIESSDIIFAVDSIPAVIAITRDPFVIITSNIFAILGLRALYFALSGLVEVFHFLKYGVACILFFVGIKMLLSEIYHIHTAISLGIIIFFLVGSVSLSLLVKKKI
ncbi:MAG TPA: TerC/Alx family metal homeostasis membrane protein [Ignavibacteriaceae bacterium]|nr:TerC/Alx family metal homeostasis membrane protein [Ignavibacteriaceae bacterium]